MVSKVPAEWWIEEPANTLMNVLNKPLDSARFVGGCVRNTILKRPISDMDVATKHRPEEVISLLEDSGINVKPTGMSHGTVTAFFSGVRFEITTLRKDVKTDGRHAVVQYTDCWQEDAKRRDFTINTLLMDQFGKIIDPLHCKQDILDGRVAFVGCPSQRIQEDALRILRFYRFHAYFNCGSPDPKSLEACRKNVNLVGSLSGERIREELFKILTSENVCDTLELMQDGLIFQKLFPADVRLAELKDLLTLEREKTDPVLRLVTAFGIKPEILALKLKLPNKVAVQLAFLNGTEISANADSNSIKLLFYNYGVMQTLDLLMVKSALDRAIIKIYKYALEISRDWKHPIFPITGSDIVSLGVSPGIAIGKTLTATENWWIANNFEPDHLSCINWARSFFENEMEKSGNG